MTGLVYSYTRFSDPRQASGNSSERQASYAARWAEEHGLQLDESLTMKDEGLSAYHQRHVKSGALGVFLAAVEEGRVPPGSVLVVEGLDRLSRAEPMVAQSQLGLIVNAGITVVTAGDGKAYSRERLRENPMDMIYSLLIMIRAFEESHTKSKRVKAAIRRQCESWIAGTNRSIIRNGKDPAWLQWNGTSFELIPERVDAVLQAIALYQGGNGALRIVRELSAKGMKFTENGVEAQQIYRTVRLRALIGEKTIAIDGTEYNLKGYYPPIMSEEDFALLQAFADQRFRRKGKGDIVNFVTGMGITHCGYCGSVMTSQNMSQRIKADGTYNPGHRRLLCGDYANNEGCKVAGSCSIVPIENAVLDFCSDQMNLTRLLSGSDAATPIIAKLNSLRTSVADAEKKIERLAAALMGDDNEAPQVFVRKVREMEEQAKKDKATIQALEYELLSVSSSHTPAQAVVWEKLRESAKALDSDSRLKLRQMVMDTFSRIVIYHRGQTPTEKNAKWIDLMLVSKHGNMRLLQIHRLTGAWKASEDYLAVA